MATIRLPPDLKEFSQLLNAHQIDLNHLKINKKASSRHKDLNDLKNLPQAGHA
jgi:hypothetical protein